MNELPPKKKRLSRAEAKEKTKQDLIQVATQLFAAKGFEGTPVDEIAEQAGYSRGAFYSNFTDKLDLMKTIIDQGFDSDVQNIQRLEELQGTDAMAQGFQALAEAFYGEPLNLLWTLEFQLSAVRHPSLRSTYGAQHNQLRRSIRKLIKIHTEREGIPTTQDKINEYADLFLVIVTGLGLMKLIHGNDLKPGVFERAFRALIRGLETDHGNL